MKRPSQMMSLLRKCRRTSGWHSEASPRAREEQNEWFPQDVRRSERKTLKNGGVRAQCQDKIPHRGTCFSVQIFPHAWQAHLHTENLEADPSYILFCTPFGLPARQSALSFPVSVTDANSFCVHDTDMVRINIGNIAKLTGFE